MSALLFISLLLGQISVLSATVFRPQGVLVQPTQSGTIAGVLRDAQGRPAAGVRVSAVVRPTSLEELGGGASMSSIAQTDAQGRYTLENVPPGRYYIAAGRLDFPTYFPGTQAMGEGTLVTVAAGATVVGIDFALRDTSAGRADAGAAASGTIIIPLSVRAENGRVPLFGDGKFTALRVTPIVAAGTPAPQPVVLPLNQPALSLNVAIPDYQLTLEGLPPGFSVRSMQYGASTLSDGRLTLLPGAPSSTSPAANAGSSNALTALATALSVGAGVQGTVQSLTIVLSRTVPAVRQGVRVSGTLKNVEPRAVYISGTPGALYADGTFEFLGVSEGLHAVFAVGNRAAMPVLGAAVVVGSADMTGIELEQTAVPPADFRKPVSPRAANSRTPGQAALASIWGQLVDSESGAAVTQGSIFLIGDSWTECELGPAGSFEFSKVLPGRYEIEVHGVGYPTFRREFVVEEQNVVLVLQAG